MRIMAHVHMGMQNMPTLHVQCEGTSNARWYKYANAACTMWGQFKRPVVHGQDVAHVHTGMQCESLLHGECENEIEIACYMQPGPEMATCEVDEMPCVEAKQGKEKHPEQNSEA